MVRFGFTLRRFVPRTGPDWTIVSSYLIMLRGCRRRGMILRSWPCQAVGTFDSTIRTHVLRLRCERATVIAGWHVLRVQAKHLRGVLALGGHFRADVAFAVGSLEPVQSLRDGFALPLVVVPLAGEGREAEIARAHPYLGRRPLGHAGRRLMRLEQRKVRIAGPFRVWPHAEVELVPGTARPAHVADIGRVIGAGSWRLLLGLLVLLLMMLMELLLLLIGWRGLRMRRQGAPT
uniref:(northern house mosquito) hypothetical protein n=1 Tax=Culex pipiens TaxID=7175 RepID=A0A8D8BIN7_CULPI